MNVLINNIPGDQKRVSSLIIPYLTKRNRRWTRCV